MLALVSAGVATGAIGLAAPTATAAEGFERCGVGYFCIFEHADGTGDYAYFSKIGSSRLRNTHQFEDKASAVWNRTNSAWVVFEHPRYKGRSMVYYPDQRDNLADGDGWWNDRISSVKKSWPSW